ncbi:TetR/AcrR family transcriptional regulator [Kutzneria sp. CA-103260]|uniref:TetR/AcrR family transcriptional regulator n=1 Tax=Kutzneria sp. CA-103260 TaxID=2802641 RepID=UPI001BA9A02E|nr:TetR family transcriptional regulator [Kutzneria sp. CA-103260]QUQ71769.1 TetR family transcriptional regulator [Kutzneria sp. CA-103260]
MTDPKRRGRRPAGEDTKAALLAAAREVFTEQGFDGATVRAIASRAEVDPAMVNHWFGGKQGLFAAAVELPVTPEFIRERVFAAGPPGEIAVRVVRTFITTWDNTGGGGFAALVRSAATQESAAQMLREFISVVFGGALRELDVDRPELRLGLFGSQIAGLGLARYVMRLEPIASADVETLVATIAPTLQHYLTGDLPVTQR